MFKLFTIAQLSLSKGQLNSEWIYEVIVSSKILTKNFNPGSSLEGRAKISVIFVWDFRRNNDIINSFWIQLAFSYFGVSFSHESRSERTERRSQNPSQVFFQVNIRTQLCMSYDLYCSNALKIREEIVWPINLQVWVNLLVQIGGVLFCVAN